MTLGQKFDTSPFPGSCTAFHIKKPWDCHRNDGKTFAAAISQGFQALVSSLMAASQSASRYASLRDVEAATERFTGSEDIQPHHRLWGPVLSNVAFATGALAPASSVLIRPADASQLEAAAARAMALFPADVFPSAEDTADTLAARLGGCGFLDDIHFKKGGHGKGGATKAINKSKYPQPRRKTWSVVVDSSQDQPRHSQDQTALYAYTQFGRKPSDWRSSPMPMEVFEFSILLWRLAMPYLGAVSKASPPTAVQVMMYYVPCWAPSRQLQRTRSASLARNRDDCRRGPHGQC